MTTERAPSVTRDTPKRDAAPVAPARSDLPPGGRGDQLSTRWLQQLARCSAEQRRAGVADVSAGVGNRGVARLAAQAGIARAPSTEAKPSSTVVRFAKGTIEQLEDDPNMKIVLSYFLNAAKLGELPAYARILKTTKHSVYGDYFIALATEINEYFSSKATVRLFKLMADHGVDVVKDLDNYSLQPLAKVAEFMSLLAEFQDLAEAGVLSKAEVDAVRSQIDDVERALRGIEGTWSKPVQVKMGAAGAAVAAWTAVGALAADDVTVVGVADDVLIPFVVVGALVLTGIAAFSGRKPEILDYAPAVAAATTAVRTMQDIVSKALQTSKGNVADTGVLAAAGALIAAKLAADLCAALRILADRARRDGDSAELKKIIATEKAKGCRHSRAKKGG